ncbi:hypothetical protein DPEC_G00119200 [Dallia pectoralis]|uniref:Uncharacterized protein n=1 Tax=Dallia pectoralis TaxID=75939 RepID=A0ACC2GPG7_DALPE|nr:hypothetical protein DPEC_G00119200 [Dallia pectoralis]
MVFFKAASFWTSAVLLLCLHSGDCSEIIGGKEVKPHSLPYMALLEDSTGDKVCGGILIQEQWVLTAAHCVNIKKVWLGVHSIKNIKKEKVTQVREVKSQFPHPNFDNKSAVNDIMLLKLDEKVVLRKEIGVLKLTVSVKDVPAGSICSVSGWGVTKNKPKTMSNVLQSVNVTVIDRKKCNSPEYYNEKPIITSKMLCAGSVGKTREDSCRGDSGGPLVCGGKLQGVVSFGGPKTKPKDPPECGVKTKPGVYTLVSKYLDWIKNTIKKLQ